MKARISAVYKSPWAPLWLFLVVAGEFFVAFLCGCGVQGLSRGGDGLFYVSLFVLLPLWIITALILPRFAVQGRTIALGDRRFHPEHQMALLLPLSLLGAYLLSLCFSWASPWIRQSGWGPLCITSIVLFSNCLFFFSGWRRVKNDYPKANTIASCTPFQDKYRLFAPYFFCSYFLLILAPYLFGRMPEVDTFFTTGYTKIIYRVFTFSYLFIYSIVGARLFKAKVNLHWLLPLCLVALTTSCGTIFSSQSYNFVLSGPMGSFIEQTETMSLYSQLFGLALFVFEGATFLCCVSFLPKAIGSRKPILALLTFVIIFCIVACLFSLIAEAPLYAESFSGQGVKTISSFFHHKNEFGAFLFLGCVSCAALRHYLQNRARFLLITTFILFCTIGLFVKCYTALVPMLVLGLAMLILELSYIRRKNAYLYWASIIGMFLFVTSIFICAYSEPIRTNVKLFQSIYNGLDQTEREIVSRTNIWSSVTRIVAGPFIFVGKGDSGAGTYLSIYRQITGGVPGSDYHSAFVTIYASHGLVGLIVYLFVLVVAFKNALQIMENNKKLCIVLLSILATSVSFSMPESYTLFINMSSIAFPTLALFFVFLPYIQNESGVISCEQR